MAATPLEQTGLESEYAKGRIVVFNVSQRAASDSSHPGVWMQSMSITSYGPLVRGDTSVSAGDRTPGSLTIIDKQTPRLVGNIVCHTTLGNTWGGGMYGTVC